MNSSHLSIRNTTRVASATLAVVTLSLTAALVSGGSAAHAANSGGGGEGKATFHSFNFTHHIDKASPVLLQY
jgi:type VI secretion system secreted protein Hcp